MLLQHVQGEQKTNLIAGLDRLMSPQAMGELFQVIALTSQPLDDMPGFE
jgi:SAM-dependent MidA family methyltransferase